MNRAVRLEADRRAMTMSDELCRWNGDNRCVAGITKETDKDKTAVDVVQEATLRKKFRVKRVRRVRRTRRQTCRVRRPYPYGCPNSLPCFECVPL